MKKFTLTVLISFFAYSFSYAQILSSSGLEIVDHQNVKVIVEDLSDEANNMGLTEDRIRSRVNLRLRQLDLKPDSRNDSFLYININILSAAYGVNISFYRSVFYYKDVFNSDELYRISANVWNSNSAGTHANSPDFIISDLDEQLDYFLSDYLDAND